MSKFKFNRSSFSVQLRRGCAIGALLVLGTSVPAHGAEPGGEIRILFSWSELLPEFLRHLLGSAGFEPSSDPHRELHSVATRSETDSEIEVEPPDPLGGTEPAEDKKRP